MGCTDVEVDVRGSGRNAKPIARIHRRQFPDGEPWLEQEVLVTEAFGIMANEIRERVKRG